MEGNSTAVAEAPNVQSTGTEGSPAAPATTDAAPAQDNRTPEQKTQMEAWNRFQRIAAQHEQQVVTDSAEAPPEPAPQTEGTDTAATAQKPEESANAEPPEGFKEAVEAMLRDGIKPERIEKWFQEDAADFMETAAKARKRQGDYDRRFGSQPKPVPQATEPAKPQGTDAPAPEATAAKLSAPKDFIEATKRAVDGVLAGLERDELHSDLKEPLGVLATGLAEQMGSYMAAELAKRDALIQQLHQRDIEREHQKQISEVTAKLDTARVKLADKFPGLKEDDGFNQVLARYDVIVAGLQSHPDPSLQSVEDVFNAAARWVFSDENPASAVDRIKSNLFKRSQQQKRGLPSSRVSAVNEKPLTPEQKAWLAFNKIADKHEGATAR